MRLRTRILTTLQRISEKRQLPALIFQTYPATLDFVKIYILCYKVLLIVLEAAKMSVHPQYLPDEDLEYECRVFHVDLEWMRSYRISTVHRRWEMEEERPQRVLIPIEGACFLDEQLVIRRRIQELQKMLSTETKKLIPDEALTRLYNTTFSLYRW
jgi:hypothetical protein